MRFQNCLVTLAMSGLCSSLHGAEAFFTESFGSSAPNTNLEGYANFTIADGSIHLTTGNPNDFDRRYMRTVVADYNARDFVYDLTFTSTSGTITFAGLGLGDGAGVAYNEPGKSVFFRIHSPDVAGGRVDVSSNEGSIEIGNIHSSGPHRARIEKGGTRVTFSLDVGFNGVFKADMSHVYPNLMSIGPFLTSDNAHLFFGTGLPGTTFDDIAIQPPVGAHPFQRGDANADGKLNIVDPVGILNSLFLGGALFCLDAADIDDNGSINISDPIGLLGYLFLGTLAPPAPFRQCGQDPNDDRLSCDDFASCS